MAKMRSPLTRCLVLVVTALFVMVVTSKVTQENKKYSATHDDLDVDAILKDDDERDRYYACFMDTGPCHNDAALFFKSKAPEAILTSCNYCTEKQKEMFEKILSWYVDNRITEWNDLIAKLIKNSKGKDYKF